MVKNDMKILELKLDNPTQLLPSNWFDVHIGNYMSNCMTLCAILMRSYIQQLHGIRVPESRNRYF